jgi:glycerophosphoryl diester phosphodiesterase
MEVITKHIRPYSVLIGIASVCMSCTLGQPPAIGSVGGYADAVLADQPVGYWRFEDPAGSARATNSADGGHSIAGVYHDVSLGSPSATSALGTAATFLGAGASSYVDLGSSDTLMIRGDLTIEWWQYMADGDTEDHAIICWARPGESSADNVLYEMVVRYTEEQKEKKTPRPQFALGHEYGAGTNARLKSPDVVHPNRWYHVVAVRDAESRSVQYYINGLPAGDPISYAESDDNAQGGEAGGAAIGRLGQFDSRYFKGLLDEVAVYNHTLSAERILEHYRVALKSMAISNPVQVVAHRGNNRFAPENTLVSYEQAIEARAPIVELDLHRSKDGVVVLLHDDTLERTTNGTGRVNDLTLEELKTLDAGSWKDARYAGEPIPTLDEIAALCKGRTIMMLDLKDPVRGDEIAPVLSRAGIANDQVIVAPWKIEQAPDIMPHLPGTSMILLHSKPPSEYTGDESFFEDMKQMGFNGFSLSWTHLPASFVDAAHRHGMKVYTWTLNNPGDISGAVLMKVDGIITDVPAAAAEHMARVQD